jgi:hypothetical protein
MSGYTSGPLAYIKRTRHDGDRWRSDTVDCPYCGEEHEHFLRGHVMAICGRGHYSIVCPL